MIATGGTGGHLYPALKVAQKLKDKGSQVQLVGALEAGILEINELGLSHIMLNIKGVRSKNIFLKIKHCWQHLLAVRLSKKIIKEFGPDVIIGFGGYGAFPVVFAGAQLKIPTMIHEQNVQPGLANKILSKFVKKIAISFKESKSKFPSGKTALTGCPCLINGAQINRRQALADFKLEGNRKTITVMGGSQGSQTINKVFLEALALMDNKEDIQVIHCTGKHDHKTVSGQYAQLNIPHAVFAYSDEMEKIYSLSDLIIARAGACTVTEILCAEIYAILIPYPFGGNHQIHNARVLSNAGLADMITEDQLNADILKSRIEEQLYTDGPQKESYNELQIKNASENIIREAESILA